MRVGLFFTALWEDEDGSAVVEGLLVLCVLIALALIFRTQLMALVNQIMNGIRNQTGTFY
ncbi:MAG: hypothetical protein IJL66_00355 [Lachnospiraceae bacterium]|nr:hypothetical protein [Lachnospiraceae bacterium]